MSNDAAGFAARYGPLSRSPIRAFDATLRRRAFPPDTGSMLPGFLAITRTGLTPAGDDELQIRSQSLDDHPLIAGRTPRSGVNADEAWASWWSMLGGGGLEVGDRAGVSTDRGGRAEELAA